MEEEEKGEATDGDLREGGMHSTSLLDEELALLLQQEEEIEFNTEQWEELEADPLEGMPDIGYKPKNGTDRLGSEIVDSEGFLNAAKQVPPHPPHN